MIAIPSSVEFNELSDVCASVHLLSNLLQNPTHNLFDWKWIILSAHSSVQGAIVCAASGTAGIGSLDKRSGKAMLEWLEQSRNDSDAKYPGERLADFSSLLTRAQDPAHMAGSQPLSLFELELQQMQKLHLLRCNFSHFLRMTWIIELDEIAKIILIAVKIVEFLTLNNNSVRYRFEDNQPETLQTDIGRIRDLLN